MPPKRYLEAALAIVLIELRQSSPAIVQEMMDSGGAVRPNAVRPCTVRDFVEANKSEDGDYEGRWDEDIYITAPALAEILEVSNETARRRLIHFKKQGVLELVTDSGRRNYYRMDPEFTGVDDEIVPSESSIVDTARKLLAATEES